MEDTQDPKAAALLESVSRLKAQRVRLERQTRELSASQKGLRESTSRLRVANLLLGTFARPVRAA